MRDRRRAPGRGSLVIGVDSVPRRLEFARKMGADVVLNYKEQDVVAEIKRLTGGGADVPSRRSERRPPSRTACAACGPAERVSSLGVYSGHLQIPLDAFAAGLGDHTVVTSLCPGGKERMRRLMSIVAAKRFPFRELVTHPFRLAEIEAAYDLFANQRDGVMKVAIRP